MVKLPIQLRVMPVLPLNRTQMMVLKQKKYSLGFTIVETVVGSLILSVLIALSSTFWNKTTNGMRISSMRAKTDSAIARRLEEIRYCSRFYEIDIASVANQSETNCSKMRLNRTVQSTYKESVDCKTSTLGAGLKRYLDSTPPYLLKTPFTLDLFDSDADRIPITIVATPNDNTLLIKLEASLEPNSVSKQTSILPNAQSWCAYPYR